MEFESLLIYTEAANPACRGRETRSQLDLASAWTPAGGAGAQRAVEGQRSSPPSAEPSSPDGACLSLLRLASSCHQSDWHSEINTGCGDNHQSVRISFYGGGPTRAAPPRGGEVTEAIGVSAINS